MKPNFSAERLANIAAAFVAEYPRLSGFFFDAGLNSEQTLARTLELALLDASMSELFDDLLPMVTARLSA